MAFFKQIKTYFFSTDGQGHSGIEVLSAVVHRLSVPKYLGFKVLDHVLHNITVGEKTKTFTVPVHWIPSSSDLTFIQR